MHFASVLHDEGAPVVATKIGPNCLQTYTGREFNPFDPDPSSIDIMDIAHALSLQCRFGGHVRRRWSVAQHSLLVAELCPDELKLAGLLHDGAEAYLVDLPRPVKHHHNMDPYRRMESHLERTIAYRFGTPWPMPEAIKRADRVVLAAEADALKHGHRAWDHEALDMADRPEGEFTWLVDAIGAWRPPSDRSVRHEFLKAFRAYGGVA